MLPTLTMTSKNKAKRFRPLKKGQIGAFEQAAQNASNNLTELAARTLLHTGLRNGEFAHMRSSWLADERMEGRPVLRVPAEERCIGGAGATGRGNPNGKNLHERGEPCYKCREGRDGSWEPKTRNSMRTLPIMEEEIYDSIERWFTNNEQIPLLHSAVANRVQQVAEAAGLSREVKPHDLRHTYGTMLARMGMSAHVITAVMGHGTLDMALTYIQFVGRDIAQEFNEKWDFDAYS